MGRRSADFDPANTDQASNFGSDSGRFGPKRTPKTPPILGPPAGFGRLTPIFSNPSSRSSLAKGQTDAGPDEHLDLKSPLGGLVVLAGASNDLERAGRLSCVRRHSVPGT